MKLQSYYLLYSDLGMAKSEKMMFYCYSGWLEPSLEGILLEISIGGQVLEDLPFLFSSFYKSRGFA